jgi:hypothetical protein
MRGQPVEADFLVEVSEDKITVRFLPTRSVYTFARLPHRRDVAEFGPLSPDAIEQHPSRGGVRGYAAGEVRGMAFRLATAAARADLGK